MRKFLTHENILFVLIITILSAASLWAQYPAQAKILTYNIWGVGHGSGPYDDIAAVINEIDPDISGHQEVDSCNARNPLDVIGWLGEQTDMFSLFAPALKNWGGGHYGEGLLADMEPLSYRLFWVEQQGGEDRSAIEIEITMGGEKVRVLTTHLAHENGEFAAYQAGEMVKWIDTGGIADIPMIIMGDFNSSPGDDAMSQYEDEGFVYVRDENGDIMDNIDHIMYRPEDRWNVVEADKPTQYTASDHDPVWAIMELLDPVDIKAGYEKNSVIHIKSDRINLSYGPMVQFELFKTSKVTIRLFNSLGKLISTIMQSSILESGAHSISLNEKSLNSGIYFIHFQIDNQRVIKKIPAIR